jgi:hypothetical protein
VFVGAATGQLWTDVEVVDGRLVFAETEQVATGSPVAAPFEVQVAGRIGRRNLGRWGLADPDGRLAAALGLRTVAVTPAEQADWRRRVLIARALLGVVGLIDLVAGARLALSPTPAPTPLGWLVGVHLLPVFGVLLIAQVRAVGVVRRACLLLGWAQVLASLSAGLALGGLAAAPVTLALALCAVAGLTLRPVPMLTAVPQPPGG